MALAMFDEARYFDNDFENLNVETVEWEGDAKGEVVDWRGVVTYTMGMLGDDYKFSARVALNDDGEVSVFNKDGEHEVGNHETVPWVYSMVELSRLYRDAEDEIKELKGEIENMDYQRDME